MPIAVSPELQNYLKRYGRATDLPIHYEDLTRYISSTPLLDQQGQDTLWETVYYSESDRNDFHRSLTYIYALLKTDGDTSVIEHLTVARIDYCTFGNTKPFRVRIINRLNDNYDHFYVKKADASRVYGLELETLLSPNNVVYLIDRSTLIEEHIAGIPGDDFIRRELNTTVFNQIRIAKEFACLATCAPTISSLILRRISKAASTACAPLTLTNNPSREEKASTFRNISKKIIPSSSSVSAI